MWYEGSALKRSLADVGVPCLATLSMRPRGCMELAVDTMGGEGYEKQLEVPADPEDTGELLLRRLRYVWPREVRFRAPWLIALPSGAPLPQDATLEDSGVHRDTRLQLRHAGSLQIRARVGEDEVSAPGHAARGSSMTAGGSSSNV